MKNIKFLVVFSIIFGCIGIHASQNNSSKSNFENCIDLRDELVTSFSKLHDNDLSSYMNSENDLYSLVYAQCNEADMNEHSFKTKMYDAIIAKQEKDKKILCNVIRQNFITALSKTDNKEALVMIAQSFKSNLDDCGYGVSNK